MSKKETFTLGKGMSKDVDVKYQPKGSYRDMLNGRLISKADNDFAAENLKGNLESFEFPAISALFQVSYTGAALVSGTTYNIAYDVNSITYTYTFSFSDNTSLHEGLASHIRSNLPVSDGVVAGSKGEYVNVVFQGNLTFTITINGASGIPAGDITITQLHPYQDLFRILGSRQEDDQYVITISGQGFTVNSDGVGQVWRISSDATTNEFDSLGTSPVVELIYSGVMGFALENTFDIISRKENSNILRLYFTDNDNPLRNINVFDEEALAISPALLSVFSPIEGFPITLDQIVSGGGLEVGVYQFAYRLKSKSGFTSQWSPISNPVSITNRDENLVNFGEYTGDNAGTGTLKAIKGIISDIDTNYDSIEVVAIQRTQLNAAPDKIEIFDQSPIGESTYQFTYTGTESNVIDVLLEDLTINDDIWDVCKTIAEKDNILFAGNLKSNALDFEFDARAYRYAISSDATYSDPNDVNPNQHTYKYKKNSTEIGGGIPGVTGVSYTIREQQIQADSIVASRNNRFRTTARDSSVITMGIDDEEYPQRGMYASMKSPYDSGLRRGYQRGEVYRFGIVFFDLKGVPGLVKWIGDIQFPDINEYEYSGVSTEFFPLTEEGADGTYQFNSMYIEFRVNITAEIRSKISGYSIVRVKRAESDRTIIGQGILTATLQDDYGTPRSFIPNIFEYNHDAIHSPAHPDLNLYTTDADYAAYNVTIGYNRGCFECPEWLFVGGPDHQSTDKIRVVATVGPKDGNYFNTDVRAQSGTTASSIRYHKLYNFYKRTNNVTSTTVNDFGLDFIQELDSRDFHETFFNRSVQDRDGSTDSGSIGNKTHYFATSSSVQWKSMQIRSGVKNKWFANYVRVRADQYGGNTNSDKEKNVYISCNNFVPVRSDTDLDEFFDVFGGDTFVTMMDFVKLFKNWDSTNENPDPAERAMLFFFFPVESYVNTELRHGDLRINADGGIPENGTGIDTTEQFFYNPAYSTENDIKTFFAEPATKVLVNEFPRRVAFSEKKIDGEDIDSWSLFKPFAFYDVEDYGQITALRNFRGQIYFTQENAFGKLAVNPRAVLPAGDGVEMVLGAGEVIDDHEYITTEYGNRHLHGVTVTDKAIYWVDAVHRKIMRHAQNGLDVLSDMKGVRNFTYNNIGALLFGSEQPALSLGIVSAYDIRHQDVIFTILNATGTTSVPVHVPVTLIYNEKVGEFISRASFVPGHYMSHNDFLLSQPPITAKNALTIAGNKVYVHDHADANYCQWYGALANDFEIELILNPAPNDVSIFTSMEVDMDSDTDKFFDEIVLSDTERTHTLTVSSDNRVRRRETMWQFPLRGLTDNDRMRDRHLSVLLRYRNRDVIFGSALNKKIKVWGGNYIFRQSFK